MTVKYREFRGERDLFVEETIQGGEKVYRIVGALFEVYNEVGYGLSEQIYQESLEFELANRKLPFESKPEIACFYKSSRLKKTYVPDLRVFGIIVELKSVSQLTDEHLGQILNYMRLTRCLLGVLANFGQSNGLGWRRVILSEYL